jgi:hypothetical protein
MDTIMTNGTLLPPPKGAPPVFIATRPSPMLDQVVDQLLQAGILQPNPDVVNAFRLFTVAKPDGSARPILDLSPWTRFYNKPPMRLYSSAQVLDALPRGAFLMKIDLKQGFFRIPVVRKHKNFYGVCYRDRRYAWTRLPMSHALAPSIMQRLPVAVARCLHAHHGVSMVAYLDDWLIFDKHRFDATAVLNTVRELGFSVNTEKSILTPVQVMVYLGLHIDTVSRTIRPTQACLQHMKQFLSIVPRASQQDLLRIRGHSMDSLCYEVAPVCGHPHPAKVNILACSTSTMWAFATTLSVTPAAVVTPALHGRDTHGSSSVLSTTPSSVDGAALHR